MSIIAECNEEEDEKHSEEDEVHQSDLSQGGEDNQGDVDVLEHPMEDQGHGTSEENSSHNYEEGGGGGATIQVEPTIE